MHQLQTIRRIPTLLTKALLIVLFGSLCLSAYWLGNRNINRPPPNGGLVVDESALNFGEVWEDPEFNWNLRVRNQSADLVRVVDFASSCGCIAIDPTAVVFEPGQETVLRLRLDLTSESIANRVQIPKAKNVRDFAITIVPRIQGKYTEPQPWTIRGRVRSAVSLSTSRIFFGDNLIEGQLAESRKVAVKAHESLKDLMVRCDPANKGILHVHRLPAQPDLFELDIKPAADLKRGPFKFTAYVGPVTIDGSSLPEIPIEVKGRIVGDLQAVPDQLLIGQRPLGELIEEKVVVQSWSGKSFDLYSIDGAGDGLKVETTWSSQHRLNVSIRVTPTRIGPHSHELRFTLKPHMPQNTEVVVPLTVSYFVVEGK